MGEALKRPAIFDQHVRVRRCAAVEPFRHERHIGNENLGSVDFLQNRFDDRRLACDALCVAVDLKTTTGLIDRAIADDISAGVFECPAHKIASYAVRRVRLPGEKDGRSHHHRHFGSVWGLAA